MSERLEAMPLSELPDVDWNASALFIERDSLDRLGEFLGDLRRQADGGPRGGARACAPRGDEGEHTRRDRVRLSPRSHATIAVITYVTVAEAYSLRRRRARGMGGGRSRPASQT